MAGPENREEKTPHGTSCHVEQRLSYIPYSLRIKTQILVGEVGKFRKTIPALGFLRLVDPPVLYQDFSPLTLVLFLANPDALPAGLILAQERTILWTT